MVWWSCRPCWAPITSSWDGWPASVPQVMRHDSASILELDGKEVSVFTPSQPREKWQRKRTHVKLRVRVLWLWGPCSCLVPCNRAVSHCCGLSYLIIEE